tara:strand:- start:137 stop:595 length:459 start_codon:yes stop_codon:yes gene_type:complete
MNKIINYTLLLFFIFLLNCSYKPILKKDKYQFSINLNKVTGDNEINRIIVRNIKNLPKSQKVYDLTLSSNKEKKIISKDTAGDPLIFQILINVEYNVNKEGKLLIEKSFNRKIKYNNISDKFEMEKYEKNIIENLSINISDMIIGSISEVNQ